MNKEYLIERIKNTGCFKSDMGLYGDRNKKVCFLWSPRGGCSITFKCFLDMIGLLDDAKQYNEWIHNYRMEIMVPNTSYIRIPDLKKELETKLLRLKKLQKSRRILKEEITMKN